ncbi:aminotransferase class V-fold PLP-dependent enzyme [Martelella alba]|uniref:Cysteine desulfurase n=2 Tax=Martelella alba TaxID=2590451 RepID=A0A506U6D8_9HYPH|nr:aminotransferase class V-fold PLP-dependent enzyme [Martelella alba]
MLTYLDNNATTRPDPAVVAAMLPYFGAHFGNAAAKHQAGAAAAAAVRKARKSVQHLVGARSDGEILFTSGGSEGDNAAIRAGLAALPGRSEIVTTTVEHPAILTLCRHLEAREGVRLRLVPVDREGGLDLEALRTAIGPKTALVSTMAANNETGIIFPLKVIGEIAHAAGALFHVDAVQAAGRIPVNIVADDIDMLTLSAHKLHGPQGIGALYLRKGIGFSPLIHGGSQQRGRRAGTENLAGTVGFGVAADLAMTRMADDASRMTALRDRLETGILRLCPQAMAVGSTLNRLANTSLIIFRNFNTDALLTRLDRAGICCSAGSACGAGQLLPSPVLLAMGFREADARAGLRFSLSRETTAAEIDHVLSVLPQILKAEAPARPEKAEAHV